MTIMNKERVYSGFVKVDKIRVAGVNFPLEVVAVTDSVAFLVHNTDTDELLFTIQDRAPMVDDTNPTGELFEVAAGRFDCGKGVVGLIEQELKEELGVHFEPGEILDHVTVINDGVPFALSPGVLTERQYLAYVTVRTSQIDFTKKFYGCREEGEKIARRFVPIADVIHGDIIIHDMKTFALIQWLTIKRRW